MKKKLTLDEFLEYTLIMLIIAAVALIGNWVSSKFTASFAESLPGILILFGIAFVGTTLARLIPVKIPAVIWITVIGILLAIEGKERSSEEFSARLDDLMLRGNSDIAFVIGGSDGVSDDVRARADEMLSFGRITLPHNLARVVLLEQIYRACKISRGEPYHK